MLVMSAGMNMLPALASCGMLSASLGFSAPDALFLSGSCVSPWSHALGTSYALTLAPVFSQATGPPYPGQATLP